MDNQTIVANSALATKILNFDITDYPIRGQGTVDGVQYSAEIETVLADTDYELLIYKTSDRFSRLKGKLVWVQFLVDLELKTGSDTADVIWKLQARNKGETTWIDMCDAQTMEDTVGTDWVEKTISGYMDIKKNIDGIPFEMRIIFQSNEASPGIATGRVKNTSFIRMIGEVR